LPFGDIQPQAPAWPPIGESGDARQFETKMTEHGIDRVRMLIFMSAGAALTLGWVAFLAWLASKVWLLW
jgi:hypothetical protein